MKKSFLALILLTIVFNLAAQRKDSLVCPAKSVNVWAYVEGHSPLPGVYLPRDILTKGFKLGLTDKSYKLVGFKIFFEFESCPMGDKMIKGDTVTIENLPELVHFKVNRGYLEFLCIVIEKDGIRYKTPNNFFVHLMEEKKAAL